MLYERLLLPALERHADAPAILGSEAPGTYAQLGARVRRLAWALARDGIRAGDRVGVLELNRPAYLEAYFALAALGSVSVPLNHRLRPEDLAHLLRHAGAASLLVGSRFAELGHQLAGLVPGLDVRSLASEQADELGDDPGPLPPSDLAPDTLAHLYYTSGTTGRPKGVMLTHANVFQHAENACLELGLKAGDRWGHIAPMFHLADAWSVFAVTLAGGAHAFVPEFDASEVLATIERERISVSNLVPTMLNALIHDPRAADRDLSSMRLVLSGGAPIATEVLVGVLELFGCDYVQTYGMTETSPFLTLGLLPDEIRDLPPARRLPYLARTGRPFLGIELEVVDESGARVPPDDATVGEIRVRGATVTRGYWKDDEATREAFHDGWLCTGDLAVVDRFGLVDIVDRKKDMIISGGEKVFSIEVENVLHRHPDVIEAAVYGAPDAHWGERVEAAVVLSSDVDPDELERFCRKHLAGFKVPRGFHLHEELPRTGSGKIAKRVLREEACVRSGRL